MHRYLSLLLFIGLAWGQSPCDDKLFKELDMKIKDQGLDALSKREWIYYQLKSDECTNEKKVSKDSDSMTVHQFGYEVFNMFENYQSEYYLCDFKLLLNKIRELKKSADKLEKLESVFQDMDLINIKKIKRSIKDD